MDEKVSVLPVRKKSAGRPVELVTTAYAECHHVHVEVNEELAELTCRDCKAKLNPIRYIASVAKQFVRWDHELERIKNARAQLEERKKCRCTKCGEMTEVRHVTNHELKEIIARKQVTPA